MGKETTSEKVSPGKAIGVVASWLFGVLFAATGLGALFAGHFVAGIAGLLGGLLLLPPLTTRVQQRFGLSTGVRVVIVIVLLVVCLGAMPREPAPPAQGAGGQQAASVVRLGEPVRAGDFTWTFTSVDRREVVGEYVGGTLLGKEASGVFLVVGVTVENTGDRASYLTASMVTLVDDRGREFVPDVGAGVYLKGQGLAFDQLNPGLVKKGVLVFDVPKDIRVARVRINSGLLSSDTYYVNLLQ
jgi:Domain of unknown function (DUF4352)